MNDDGVSNEILVSTTHSDFMGANSGAAWLLWLSSQAIVLSYQRLLPGEGSFTAAIKDYDFWGYGASALRDIDGDGVFNEAAVSAYKRDGSYSNSGSVDIIFFHGNGTVRSHQRVAEGVGGLESHTFAANEWLGYELAELSSSIPGWDLAVSADQYCSSCFGYVPIYLFYLYLYIYISHPCHVYLLAPCAARHIISRLSCVPVMLWALASDGSVSSFTTISHGGSDFTAALNEKDYFGAGMNMLDETFFVVTAMTAQELFIFFPAPCGEVEQRGYSFTESPIPAFYQNVACDPRLSEQQQDPGIVYCVNATWPQVSGCVLFNCSVEPVQVGYVFSFPSEEALFLTDDTLTGSCADGYDWNGENATVTCLSAAVDDNTWSSLSELDPICAEVDECVLTGDNQACPGEHECVNLQGSYMCLPLIIQVNHTVQLLDMAGGDYMSFKIGFRPGSDFNHTSQGAAEPYEIDATYRFSIYLQAAATGDLFPVTNFTSLTYDQASGELVVNASTPPGYGRNISLALT